MRDKVKTEHYRTGEIERTTGRTREHCSDRKMDENDSRTIAGLDCLPVCGLHDVYTISHVELSSSSRRPALAASPGTNMSHPDLGARAEFVDQS